MRREFNMDTIGVGLCDRDRRLAREIVESIAGKLAMRGLSLTHTDHLALLTGLIAEEVAECVGMVMDRLPALPEQAEILSFPRGELSTEEQEVYHRLNRQHHAPAMPVDPPDERGGQ